MRIIKIKVVKSLQGFYCLFERILMKVQEVKNYLKENGFKVQGYWESEYNKRPLFRGELFYSPIGKAFKKNAVCYSVVLDVGWCSFLDQGEMELGLRVKVKVGSDTCRERNLFVLSELATFIAQVEDEYLSNRVISIR